MTPRIALLIDFENISSIDDVKTVLRWSDGRGLVVVKKAFGDWAGPIENGQTPLMELGIELVHQAGIGKGRNGCDMRVVIEAMDLLHDASRKIDMFVLATSDVDFVPLAVKLRSSGKVVVAAGRPEVTSDLLKATVDEFISVGRQARSKDMATSHESAGSPIGDEVARVAEVQTDDVRYARLVDSQPVTTGGTEKLRGHDAKLLVMSAIFDLASRRQGTIKGARLLQTMKAIDPSFDFRALSFKSFADFLASDDRLEVHGRGSPGDITVTVKDAESVD